MVGYGSDDIAGNVVYALLTSFVMIYFTDTVGLNLGIVGTLIAASKLLDGVIDVFFGSMIDKTKSKMGKQIYLFICNKLTYPVNHSWCSIGIRRWSSRLGIQE